MVPKLHGLCKRHKKDYQLRLMLPMSNPSYFKIAKKITKSSSQILETRIDPSSQDVTEGIKTITLKKDETLVF